MARTKKIKYELLPQQERYFDPSAPLGMTAITPKPWTRLSTIFPWKSKLILEVACGRGEYTVWLAQHHPDSAYIWIDIKWERMRTGIQQSKELWLDNTAFLRIIVQHIDQYFAPWEIDEIWVVHPDPYPKDSDERRRLTCPRFLKLYYQLLKIWWKLHFKTDARALFDYSLVQISQNNFEIQNFTYNLHESELHQDHFGVQTNYEKIALKEWRAINYLVAEKI